VIPGILNQHKEENPKRRKTKSFSNQLKHFLKQSYTWEAEIKKIKVQDQPRQKVSEALFKKKKLGMVVTAYNPSLLGGRGKRTIVLG
jgi:hypothetical protein